MSIKNNSRRAFTLVEVLVVVGIVAIISIAVTIFLNPAELFKQSRDSRRVSDLYNIGKTLDYYQEDKVSTLGSSSVIYISIPDRTATSSAGDQCQGLGMPAVTGYTYHCAATSTYNKIDGTGWIPLNFNTLSEKTPISSLPSDPINQSSTFNYYEYLTDGTNYEITAPLESKKNKTVMTSDDGIYTNLYEVGTAFTLMPIDYAGAPSLYVADADNNRIQKFNLSLLYLSQFNASSPIALAFDSTGNIFTLGAKVQKFTSAGVYVSQFGTTGSGNGQLQYPSGIAIDASNNIYVVDAGNERVEKFNSAGVYQSQFGTSGSGNGQIASYPPAGGIAIDATGNVYVVDTGNNRVEKFNSAGVYQSQFGTMGGGNGQFYNPTGIAIDPSGNIYVIDNSNTRVEKFDSNGNYLSQFGSYGAGAGSFYYGDVGITTDSSGNVYVEDAWNPSVEKFDSNGTYLSQSGVYPASYGSGNGQFYHIYGAGVQ